MKKITQIVLTLYGGMFITLLCVLVFDFSMFNSQVVCRKGMKRIEYVFPVRPVACWLWETPGKEKS